MTELLQEKLLQVIETMDRPDAKNLRDCVAVRKELTALASTNVGFAHEMRYDRLVAGFLNYPGSTTAERVAAFVKEQGFTDDDIKRLKALLLE